MKCGELPKPNANETITAKNGATCIIEARQPILHCTSCGDQRSANPGDYWDRPKDKEITCGDCDQPYVLVYRHEAVVPYDKENDYHHFMEALWNA